MGTRLLTWEINRQHPSVVMTTWTITTGEGSIIRPSITHPWIRPGFDCILCMRWQSPSLGHPSTADEARYWLKCVLLILHNIEVFKEMWFIEEYEQMKERLLLLFFLVCTPPTSVHSLKYTSANLHYALLQLYFLFHEYNSHCTVGFNCHWTQA